MKKIILFITLVFSLFSFAADGELSIQKVARLSISGSINPATANYIETSFKKAQKESINLIVLEINTPGGLVTTTKDILEIFGESDIPVVVWIYPSSASATSAGAIIASGSHLLFMGPGTNIGAATPVQMTGNIEGKEGDKSDLRKKAINDLVSLVQSLSEAHHRNPEPFGKMIAEAKSYTSQEALEKKLINGIASTRKELREQINGSKIQMKGKELQLKMDADAIWIDFPMDLGQKILDIFSNPSMAYILFLLGAALIYLEFQAAGGFIAGSLGAVCLLLAGIGFQVLPLNMGALALIILSLILFIMEIYITSYGILSVAGLITLIAGSLFLFRTDDAYLHFSHTLVFSTVSAVAVFIAAVGYLFIKDLKKNNQNQFNNLVGHEGKITKIISNTHGVYHYQVKIGGEVWNAESTTDYKENDFVTVRDQKDDSLILII